MHWLVLHSPPCCINTLSLPICYAAQWKDFWRLHLIHHDIRATPINILAQWSTHRLHFVNWIPVVIDLFGVGVIHSIMNQEYTEHGPWCVWVGGFWAKRPTIVGSDPTQGSDQTKADNLYRTFLSRRRFWRLTSLIWIWTLAGRLWQPINPTSFEVTAYIWTIYLA